MCPQCRATIEWLEQIVDQEKRAPRPGDNFICAECAGVSVVTSENRLRPMTEAELRARWPASQKIIRQAQTEAKLRSGLTDPTPRNKHDKLPSAASA